MQSDHDRRQLFAALEQSIGSGPAGTLMELLPPVGWADLARQSDVESVRGEIAELRGEVRGEIAELRGEIRGEFGKVQGEIAQLSARIDGQIPKFLWANVPLVAAVAGLVLAAARLG